jgi:hypothetical protein
MAVRYEDSRLEALVVNTRRRQLSLDTVEDRVDFRIERLARVHLKVVVCGLIGEEGLRKTQQEDVGQSDGRGHITESLVRPALGLQCPILVVSSQRRGQLSSHHTLLRRMVVDNWSRSDYFRMSSRISSLPRTFRYSPRATLALF